MKKHLKKITALVLAVVMIFSLAACGGKADPAEVVAKVNDVEITRGQVEGFTKIYTYMLGYEQEELTDEQFELILQDYVNVELVRQHYKANEENIYPDSFEDDKAAFIESAHTDGKEFVDGNAITDEHLADFFDAQYVTNAVLSDIMEEHPEEELKPEAEKYYEENQAYFKDQETGEVAPIDEYLESIYYMLYQELYQEFVEDLAEQFTVEYM